MNRQDIHPGLILRVIDSHDINAPFRALATVETMSNPTLDIGSARSAPRQEINEAREAVPVALMG
jgi:hypothetical protein